MKTKPAAGPWETGRPKYAAESEIPRCNIDNVVSGEAEDNKCVCVWLWKEQIEGDIFKLLLPSSKHMASQE